jgi:hypothetical protein
VSELRRRALRSESKAASAQKSSRAFTVLAGILCTTSSGDGNSNSRDQGVLRRVRVRVCDGSRTDFLKKVLEHECSRQRIQGALRFGLSSHRESLRRLARSRQLVPKELPGLGRERRARDASLRGRETGRAHTMRPAGSMRAEGTGEKTLEANQGPERMPTRVTATRQLERRTPRRVRAVTVSRHEAHGGSVQPIRRETFGVETLKSGSTL